MSDPTPTSGWLSFLTHNRPASGRILSVIGAALAALTGWLVYTYGNEQLPFILWTGLLACAALGGGLWQWFGTPRPGTEGDSARLLHLSLAAAFGGGTFLLGLGLLYFWSEPLVKLLQTGDREEAWKVLVALAAMVGGLAIMFAGLQAVRSEERRSAIIRRTLYGFNSFLGGFLLLAILVVVNVLAVIKLPAAIDATRSGLYTISEGTKKLLASIDRPVTAYLIYVGADEGGENSFAYGEMRNFLTTCQEYTPRLTVNELNIVSRVKDVRELIRKFSQIGSDREGMLLVYGEEKPENASFVKMRDLVSQDFGGMGGREATVKFQGEVKFDTELTFLMGGKEKPVLYFTQGHSEADLNDSVKKTGIGKLKDKLTKRNFEVKPLTIDPISPKVPDDAKIVVIVGPRQPFGPADADALRAFTERGGKLLAFFDVPVESRTEKQIPATGLEGLFANMNVEITRERVLMYSGRGSVTEDSELAVMVRSRGAADNPIAQLVENPVPIQNPRVIRPLPNPANPAMQAATLFEVPFQFRIWAESDLQANGDQISRLMERDPNERKRLSSTSLSIAVTVTESPMAPPGQKTESKPKAIVFGSSALTANLNNESQGSSGTLELFTTMIEWLREKPANIGIEPRTYQTFELSPDVRLRADRLRWLPLLIACLGVFGLGMGVWLVRRQ